MATESLTSWQNLLKIMFEPGNLREALTDNVILYKWMREMGNIRSYGGREIRFPVKNQRQEGVGYLANGSSTLPTPTVTGSLEATFNVRNVYGVGEIDDMTIEDSRSSDFAYEQAQRQIRDDLLLSMLQDITAAWYDDGRARLAILPAADNATTVTVNQPCWLRQGMRVDCIDADDDVSKIVDSTSVSAVDHQGGSTLATAVVDLADALAGSAQNDYFTLEDAIAAGPAQLAPHGLRSGCLAANTPLENYGNINRTTNGNEAWQGNSSSNSGTNRDPTAKLFQSLLTLVRRRSSTRIKVANLKGLTNWGVAQTIFEQLAPDRQILVKGKEAMGLAQGFATGAQESGTPFAYFNGTIPFHADEMAPANTMFLLNCAAWYIYETHPPELIDRDGSILHRIETRPAYQFRWLHRHEFFTNSPSSQVIISDLVETIG